MAIVLLFLIILVGCPVLGFYVPNIGIFLCWFAFDHREPWEGFLICGGLLLLVPLITKLLLYPNKSSGFGPLGFEVAAISLVFSSILSVFEAAIFLFIHWGLSFPLSCVLAPLGPVFVFGYAMFSERLVFRENAKNKISWRDFALLLLYLTFPILLFNYGYMGVLNQIPEIIHQYGERLYALDMGLFLFAIAAWIAVGRSKRINYLPRDGDGTIALQIGIYSIIQLDLVLDQLITYLQFGSSIAFCLAIFGTLLILAVPILCDLVLRQILPFVRPK